jgi:hypothetical protein
VNAARSDPPTPRARARTRAAQRWEQKQMARKNERRSGGENAESRGTKSSGCASSRGSLPPATPECSSSDEEEEEDSDGGQAPLERWEPTPPRREPRRRRRNECLGAGAPAAGRSTEEAAHAAEVPACTAEASRGAMVAASAVASAPAEPSRKRKRGFSTLR